jgi:hypothetical protein
MPTYIPTGILPRKHFYINGTLSIKYFLDWMLSVIIALYSGKLVSYMKSTEVESIKVTSFIVTVLNWSTFYNYTFLVFIEELSKCFRYKEQGPFTIENLQSSDSVRYELFINYDFYRGLDSGFNFPNLNVVIKKLLDEFMINPCYVFEPQILRSCKLEYPLTVFIKPRKGGNSKQSFVPISESPDVPLKLEASQLKQINEMLSQMIEHIYETMVTEDYSRLQAVIFNVHAIYSSKKSSKKRNLSEPSEEVRSQKPRIEPPVDDTPESQKPIIEQPVDDTPAYAPVYSPAYALAYAEEYD